LGIEAKQVASNGYENRIKSTALHTSIRVFGKWTKEFRRLGEAAIRIAGLVCYTEDISLLIAPKPSSGRIFSEN
jgi:hypothetical protein